jgi:hypothetical protein
VHFFLMFSFNNFHFDFHFWFLFYLTWNKYVNMKNDKKYECLTSLTF